MRSVARHGIAVLLLILATACASQSGTRDGPAPVRAAPPPSDYLYLSGADLSTEKNIQLGVNTDLFGKAEEQDVRLSVGFGIYFAGAAADARPTDATTIGSGLKATDPIRLSPPGAADAELDAALNVLATRAPDRHNIIGELFRSPNRRYLVLIAFDTRSGANSLYFDVTNWANQAVNY